MALELSGLQDIDLADNFERSLEVSQARTWYI